MIKLKELLSETSISMGQVRSNPYVHSFKSPEQIEEKVARPFSEHLRKAQDEIEYMISNGPNPDGDDSVYAKPREAMKLLQIAQKSLGKIK